MADGTVSVIQDHNEEEEMIVNQEFKMWKKSAPYHYDLCLSKSLQWPSTTFQWLPELESDDHFYLHYAYISSNTLDNQSELQKIKIRVPKENQAQKYIQHSQPKVQIIQRVMLGSEINRARFCYARSDLVATTQVNGEILLILKGQIIYKLSGHTQEGFGLCWNPINHSYIASGNSDKKIMIWNVERTKTETNKIEPLIEIQCGAPVEDVAWHKMHENILASCSDDRMIMLWDTRFRCANKQANRKPLFEVIAHTNQIYSLDFNNFNQFLLLSGSADENVSIWDMRNLTRSVQTLQTQGSVSKVQWSPHSVNLFASCGFDHRVNIWDISTMSSASQFTTPLTKKQDELKPKEAREKNDKEKEKGCLFSHEGHRSKVLDMDWNQHERFMMGSVEETNSLQIWEMKKQFYYGDTN